MGYQQFTHKRATVIYDDEMLGDDCEKLFRADWLAANCGSAEVERGKAVMFSYAGHDLVFKQYHRGGLAGRVVEKSYLYSRLPNTRVWREFHMLREMRDLGLPVPRPVAARCVSVPPLAYRGALITERVPNSETLAQVLCKGPMDEPLWQSLGQLIARFHQQNVYHADLNVHNILLAGADGREPSWYLIDFDKGAIRNPLSRQDADSNVARLRRSLDKELGRLPGFQFSEQDWQALEGAYRNARLEQGQNK
ncbi:3-deoxy-D-manno-octulosonic acid kinase [Microbulbifer agarilyticus]|uniref:3-deoxy-D-manno-octulosonic acid kinase n=1 Tax=Microbulbifer agarilyticus TaxID=260552 RepID=UPI001CD59358|nr:3-deoxy-D-manno-octulosonic acid kinase [Microbulbifer agarilyticus]MCA0892694.1 3-deoxy-D-manno-octulosonic acid kinase [Microbulbifer agarilyticus]